MKLWNIISILEKHVGNGGYPISEYNEALKSIKMMISISLLIYFKKIYRMKVLNL